MRPIEDIKTWRMLAKIIEKKEGLKVDEIELRKQIISDIESDLTLQDLQDWKEVRRALIIVYEIVEGKKEVKK